MKNNKGITLTSLVLYVLSFLMICGMIAIITTFFYNNEKVLSDEATDSVEWDIFNIYMAKECNIKGNKLKVAVKEKEIYFIFEQTGNVICYNEMKYQGFTFKNYNEEMLEKSFALTKPIIKDKDISVTVFDDNPNGKLLNDGDTVEVEKKFKVAVILNGIEYEQIYYLAK